MGNRLYAWAARSWTFFAAFFAVVLLALHFLHLRADFPNFSPWMDYAKYTDEGWYGNAAVAYFIRGGWYVPGDFNPAVALPVWPFLEWVLFHFTGVSISAARALALTIFAGNVTLTYWLVRTQAPRWAAWLSVVIVASSAYLYCFSRLAILEPLLVLLLLFSWVMALRLRETTRGPARALVLMSVGLLLCTMVLTKTTAVFLFPSVFFLLWNSLRQDRRGFFPALGITALAAAVPWVFYYFAVVRPRFLVDYRYLFTSNQYPQPSTLGGWLMAFWYSVHGVFWIDRWLTLLAATVFALSLILLRCLWRNPVFAACSLASAGYLFFIGFHNNMQPRYYQVVAFPLAILVVFGIESLWRRRDRFSLAAGALAAGALAFTLFINTRETVWFAFHPQYTFVTAAENLTHYIDQHPNRNRMLLSISGSNIALITGLPAICDDFGTLDLPDRIRLYQPGWYAAWNELDPGTLEDLHTQFNLVQVANFPAYDDEDRDNLILYKLIPLDQNAQPARQPRHSRRKPLGAAAGNPAIRRVSG